MNYKEAACHLDMTVKLLKWFTRNAVKGEKLIEVTPGNFDLTELNKFNEHLKAKWPTRNVPAGISYELKREAKGICGNCQQHSFNLEEAHIDRKGREVTDYCQHPHNLILLCPTCHKRYDDKNDKFVTNDVIHSNKDRVLQGLMLDVKADIEQANLIKLSVEKLTVGFSSSGQNKEQWWDSFAGAIYERIVESGVYSQATSPLAAPASGSELKETMNYISSSVSQSKPVTSGVLDTISNNIGSEPHPHLDDEWEEIEAEGTCERCGEKAMLGVLVCAGCDEEDHSVITEESYISEEISDGVYIIQLLLADGSMKLHKCSNCQKAEFVELQYQPFCSYCDYQMAKDD